MDEADRTYDVKITDIAKEQLIAHSRFLTEVSVKAANRLVDDFLESARTLSQFPERCPWLVHEDIPFQKYRKIMFGKYHMALFQIRDSVVYVTAVVDCRQDYSWLL
jgi:Plasmid stabilisation system protein.